MNKIKELILDFLLGPLAFLWDCVYRLRRFFYNTDLFEKMVFEVPVVSVGNLTFGGSGKTPMTLWLANYFSSIQLRSMILMRGYKGRLEYSHGHLRSSKKLAGGPSLYGDEAMMLFKRLENTSIVVGKNRAENLKYYFEEEGPDVVILDDGHQHLRMARDVNIVLFDSLLPLESYRTAPRGYLREGLSALKDADLVVLTRTDLADQHHLEKLRQLVAKIIPPGVFIAESVYEAKCLRDAAMEMAGPIDDLKQKNVILVAGIASPESFFQLVERLGAQVIHREIYSDHHKYKQAEIDRLLSMARESNAIVVTTEKDMVKIKQFTHDPLMTFLEIDLIFTKGEEEVKKSVSKAFRAR